LESLDGFGGQGQQALLSSFAKDPDLRIRQLKIFESEIEDLMRAEAIQQHQGDQSEISKSAKAAPELGDLAGGQWHNHPPCLPEPETGSQDAMWPSVAEWRSYEVGALEMARSCGQRMS